MSSSGGGPPEVEEPSPVVAVPLAVVGSEAEAEVGLSAPVEVGPFDPPEVPGGPVVGGSAAMLRGGGFF